MKYRILSMIKSKKYKILFSLVLNILQIYIYKKNNHTIICMFVILYFVERFNLQFIYFLNLLLKLILKKYQESNKLKFKEVL